MQRCMDRGRYGVRREILRILNDGRGMDEKAGGNKEN